MSLTKLALASTQAQSRMFYKILTNHGHEAAEAYTRLANNAGILDYFKKVQKITKHTPKMLTHSVPELEHKLHTESGILKSKLLPKSRYKVPTENYVNL